MEDIPLSYLFSSLLVLLLLSAFFSSSETALMALNRYRLRHLANQGNKAAKRAQRLLAKPDRLIGIILLGNNLVNILAASLATVIGIRLAGETGLLLAPFALTLVVLIFAEVAPKTWAANRPESIALPASYPLRALLLLLYPVVAVINWTANLLLLPFGLKEPRQTDDLSRDELRTLVHEAGSRFAAHQSMLLNILDLDQGSVLDIMVPRNEIIGIDLKDDWESIVEHIANSFYTRLPVFEGEIDNIVGILHIRTVIRRLAASQLDITSLRRATRKPYFVPEFTSLPKQLLEFQDRERRLALVVDEYGDIQGLITLDDILEEIVGEFTTEPKQRTRSISKRKDGTYVVDGGETIRHINRRLNWDLPTGGARTLNGLLTELLEAIPESGTSVEIEGLTMTIIKIHDNAIKTVEVRITEPTESES